MDAELLGRLERLEARDEIRQLVARYCLALTHNLGGYPGEMVSFVSILGTDHD